MHAEKQTQLHVERTNVRDGISAGGDGGEAIEEDDDPEEGNGEEPSGVESNPREVDRNLLPKVASDLGERLLFVPVPRVRPLVLQQLTIGLHSFLVCGFRRALVERVVSVEAVVLNETKHSDLVLVFAVLGILHDVPCDGAPLGIREEILLVTHSDVVFLVVLLEGSGEVGLLLEVFGDNWDGGVPQLDVIKEPLPECLDPQIVLLHTYTTDTVH
jgi:hypothetical protein